MLAALVALILWFAGVAFVVWVIRTYFPNLPALVGAAIIAAITLGLLRALRMWVCAWLCGGGA